jgi:hypothetical protein
MCRGENKCIHSSYKKPEGDWLEKLGIHVRTTLKHMLKKKLWRV